MYQISKTKFFLRASLSFRIIVYIKITVFLDMTCSLVDRYRRFSGTNYLRIGSDR
jgi:hypothetical protein